MKTRLNLYLILRKMCNQRNTTSNRMKSKWLAIFTVVTIALSFPFAKVKADTDFTQGSAVFTLNSANGYIEAKIMGMDYQGTNDELDEILLYYLDPITGTWIQFFNGDMDNGDVWQKFGDCPLVSNMFTTATTNYKYGHLRFNYPRNLFQNNVVIKAAVDWDLDSNNTNTGTDYTFYYNINGLDDLPWLDFWSTTYDNTKNTISFSFENCEIYGKGVSQVQTSYEPRNELDTIIVEYQDPRNSQWVTVFSGDCDSSFNYTSFKLISKTSDGSFTKTTNLAADRKYLYETTVVWDKVPSHLWGKTIQFRYRADWDIRANETNGGIDQENTFYINFNSIQKPATKEAGCNYSPENQTVKIEWTDANNISNPIPVFAYHIKRGLKDGLTSEFITPAEGIISEEFTDSLIENWKDYVYTIYSIPTSWGWTRNELIEEYSATYNVTTNSNILPFVFTLTAFPTNGPILPYIKLDWQQKWTSKNKAELYHRSSNSTVFELVKVLEPGTTSYIDDEVEDNSRHIYKIKLEVFGREFEIVDSITVEKVVAFNSIAASKNTIGDRIQLSWEIDDLDLCDRFEIYRSYTRDSSGMDVTTTPEMVHQLSAQTVYNTWDDMTAMAGVVYEYKIIAYNKGIDNKIRKSESSSDIGFRTPVGTISGRITYGGGTAVDKVSVYVESSSLDENMLYKSLLLKGENSQKSQVNLTNTKHGCIKNGFSYQSWITSSRPNRYTPVFEVNNEYSIGVRNDSILAFIGTFNLAKPSIKCKLDSTIKLNNFFNLSITLDTKDSIKVYVNGKPKAKTKLIESVSTHNCTFSELDKVVGTVVTPKTKCYIGNKTDETLSLVNPYSGNIDDIRLWGRAITASEILNNYNRYLSGSETGLIGYWPLDEGINSYAFDCSKANQKFNEHHIKLVNSYTSSNVPAKEQLAIKGLTDTDGNYIIRGIPFTGEGSTYAIKPMLGTHKFEPSQLVKYISPSSLIHNSSDFTDKSSFPIKIRVKYSNTNYPVPGVMFYVDETPCSIENKLVTTSTQLNTDNTRTGEFKTIDVGECVIDVPIGEHYIRAELSGHTFENKGRWPSVGKRVFNENSVNVIDFRDTTLVSVVGRVVGGEIENSYPIGFKNSDSEKNHTSHANIGKARILMEPAVYKNYDLNNTPNDIIQALSTSEKNKFGSISKYLKTSNTVEIITDSLTGEYMVKLPPIQWDITSVKTSTNATYSYDKAITQDIQSFKTSTMITSFDTARIVETNKLDTFFYNVKKSFVYQAPMNIEVRQINEDRTLGTAYGESEWHITAPNTAEEIRYLYTTATLPKNVKYIYGIDSTDNSYPNGKPIFIQNQVYRFNIYAYESYAHPEGLETTTMKLYSKVPLVGAIVNVKNEIGLLQKKIVPDPNDTIAAHVMKLDKNGKINYAFKAGFPNLADVNSGLGMTISVKNGTTPTQYWNEMGDFRGIVTGCEPIAGTNFVTQGPSVLLAVLHDPPGSNSYAYMESGSTISYSFVDKDIKSRNYSATTKISAGPKLETATGFGFMVMTKIESDDNIKVGVEGEWSSFTGDTEGKTITTKERIQTSALPGFVGSNADVFIGTSTNVYYCDSKYLNIKKDGLEIDTVSTSNIKGTTDFRFSQNEIVTAQIPKWKGILRQLLHYVPSASPDTAITYYQNKADKDGINYYYTSISPSASNFGKELYTIVRPKDSKNKCDTVEVIVNTIASWEDIIRQNEMAKKNASTNTYYSKDNISFDAGSTIDRSYTYVTSNGTTSGESDVNRAIVGTNFGFSINKIGFNVDVCAQRGGGSSDETNTGTTTSTTFGYVLSDPDADNRFAVDVYKNKLLDKDAEDLEDLTDAYVDDCLKSYIFELVGGQSSCPHEAADSSLYYKVNNKSVKLANGTQALDAPYIMVKSFTKTDIPNGKDATFNLELGNQSIIQAPRAYMLSVVDQSNKYGAVVSVDGTPLSTGRIFYVTPGQILTKTLTLHQTRLDVLDYQNIKLKFSSICDTSIYVNQNINVTYVPSCSDLEIALGRQIINVKDTSALQVTFKNFNQEYTNFLGIELQYKMEGDIQWKSVVFAKDSISRVVLNGKNIESTLIPNKGNSYISSFPTSLSFKGLNDGVYTIRAKTLCDNGKEPLIYNMTEEYNVIKDVESPRLMGVPSPANGILTPETEISVTFNENIQTSKLIPGNFEVRGVLNNAPMQHAEGLALDGTLKSQAFTESIISLQNNSFAIEGWVRVDANCPDYGNLFAIGSGSNKVALNMKENGMELRINDALIASGVIEDISDWQYVSLSYDASEQIISVYLLTSSTSATIISKKLLSPVSPVGRLTIGTGFKGEIHQVVVWSESRKIDDLEDMNTVKTGTENNLVGYWPMNEGSGTIAVDKVRNRNMIVNSSWFIEPNGKAAVFNGIDQSTIIKSDSIPLTNKDNFTLEFWFKGKSQSNATMFSCGKGVDDLDSSEKLSVGFNTNRELCLKTNDNTFVIPNVSVLDTLWHHFAMSVLRNSYTNIYIDGLQKLQLTSSKIGGMASDSIAIGSCRYTDSVEVSSGKYNYYKAQNQYFNGSIDEVRIWKSTLSADNIRLDMHSRLVGSEVGLIAYYPFEETATGSTAPYSLKDFSGKAVLFAKSNATEGSNTPGIKIPRTKEDVSYSYTASDNKIIFTINPSLAKIENCTLEFAIKNVIDMNGNNLASPIKWTAFVNNNRLNWETEQIAITKQVMDASGFKATIVNNSGKYENYVIDGLPAWLSVNKTSGKLNPLEKTELTFTVDNAVNVGSYESRVTLTGNNGIQEMLPISLKVTGIRPDWAVNPYDFSSSMSITGQIQIENVFQEDSEDMLAAFIGNRCVGIASPQFNKMKNSFIIYMDVYGSDADERDKPSVKFSLWDAGTGRIYPDVDILKGEDVTTIKYFAYDMIGSIDSTQKFNATDKIEQQLNMRPGWNWVSTNVVNTINPLLTQFKSGMEDAGVQIKSRQSGFADYVSGAWYGSLSAIDQKSMYMVKTNQAKTVKLVGAMAQPADTVNKIEIDSLWNWIGYTPQFIAPVGVALAGVGPRDGDQVKGQVGFATYSGGTWNGSLQYMTPGLGYMYYSKNKKDGFNYPSQYLGASRMKNIDNENSTLKWVPIVGKFQQSMTLTAVATINGKEVANTDLEIGVFIDNECRGSISLQYIAPYNRYVAYLTIWGNPEDINKKFTFKSYNQSTEIELISNDMTLAYSPNNIVGSTVAPFVISFNTTITNEMLLDGQAIYPNPVVNTLYFDYNPGEIEMFEIVDCTGRILVNNNNVNKNSVNVDGLVPGIYTLRVNYKGEKYVHRFIKK